MLEGKKHKKRLFFDFSIFNNFIKKHPVTEY